MFTKIMAPLLYKYLNNTQVIEIKVWIRNIGAKEIVLHVFRKCRWCQNIGINSSLPLTDQDQGKSKKEGKTSTIVEELFKA